ncbi:electron transport complex subunit RsxC, partial [Rodentibacter heylii]|nr:electron transport complex subunit RsxC [Rodentibacter heylii]
PTALAPKKAAVAAAIARAKAKKLAQTNHDSDITTENAEQETGEKPTALDPKKAAVAAAIARAKAKKLAQAQQKSDNAQE